MEEMQEGQRFSPTEQQIIDYVLERPHDIEKLSVRELSEQAFVSTAAIIRLCQKLHLSGYNEFKARLSEELKRAMLLEVRRHRPVTNRDTPKAVLDKMLTLSQEALSETRAELDPHTLAALARRMHKARLIDVYAYDQNFYYAELMAFNWVHVGCNVQLSHAMNTQHTQAVHADKTHVAFIISSTGENRRLVPIARILKERQVHSVLLTAARDSSLWMLAAETLYVSARPDYLDFGSTFFSVGIRYVIDSLSAMLLAQNFEQAEKDYRLFEGNFGGSNDDWHLW